MCDREAAGLDDLELEVQRERGGEHVEAGAEVGRGRRHAHQPAPAQRHSSTARSIAPSSGSHGTTAPACAERGLRILQPVAGEHAHDPPRVAGAVGEQPGDARRRRRLAEDPLVAARKR